MSHFITENMCEDYSVWSHGASFDIPLLDVAARRVNTVLPWRHLNVRDTRTLVALYPNVKRVIPTLKHCAKADAIAQAIWVRTILLVHDLMVGSQRR